MDFLIVGLGSMGKRRARLLQGLGHRVFGVESAPARRAEAESLGIVPFAGLAEALAAAPCAAGFVCTAPLSHHSIILELLQAGLPVFSELNLVADGYEEILHLAEEKRLPLFLSSTMLYRAETQYIAQRVAAFARPVNYVYHIGQYLPDWHPWEDYRSFFVGDARSGGVREILGIELPWLTQTFGPARPAHVQKNTLSTLELPYADSLFATLAHQNGTIGMLCADVVCPKAQRSFEAFGEGLHLFWEGSPATLFEYDAETKEKRRVDTYDSYEQDPRYSDNIVENAYLDEILDFLALLENGTHAPKWGFAQDFAVIHLMDEIDAGKGGAAFA